MAIRAINDQLLLLERTFLDPIHLALIKKIHLIQSPDNFSSDEDQSLVGLISKLSQIFGSEDFKNEANDVQFALKSALKARLSILVHTIQNAAEIIDDFV